eukprot:182769_1
MRNPVVICITISSYQPHTLDIPAVEQDKKDLIETFSNKMGYQVFVLKHGTWTEEIIKSVIDSVLTYMEVTRDTDDAHDGVIVVYAGHGSSQHIVTSPGVKLFYMNIVHTIQLELPNLPLHIILDCCQGNYRRTWDNAYFNVDKETIEKYCQDWTFLDHFPHEATLDKFGRDRKEGELNFYRRYGCTGGNVARASLVTKWVPSDPGYGSFDGVLVANMCRVVNELIKRGVDAICVDSLQAAIDIAIQKKNTYGNHLGVCQAGSRMKIAWFKNESGRNSVTELEYKDKDTSTYACIGVVGSWEMLPIKSQTLVDGFLRQLTVCGPYDDDVAGIPEEGYTSKHVVWEKD